MDNVERIDALRKIEEIQQLQDKLHRRNETVERFVRIATDQREKLKRRNMQIKDLKKQLKPVCNINKNHTLLKRGHSCVECNSIIL